MVHQPSGGFQGQASDIEIHAREILSIRRRLNEIYVHHTGQPIEAIEEPLQRDRFLTPADARAFGLLDEALTQRPAAAQPEATPAAGTPTPPIPPPPPNPAPPPTTPRPAPR